METITLIAFVLAERRSRGTKELQADQIGDLSAWLPGGDDRRILLEENRYWACSSRMIDRRGDTGTLGFETILFGVAFARTIGPEKLLIF